MLRAGGPAILYLATFLACSLATSRGEAQSVDPFHLPAETVRLPNGLTVVLAPDPSAPLVTVVASYAVGSADDPDGLRGLAHVVEHVVWNQTRGGLNPVRELELAGGCRMNAVTGIDSTAYFESVPPERLATALWVESERMGYANEGVTAESVAATRPVVANEDRDRFVDATFGAVLGFGWKELFPAWHPYSGTNQDVDDVERISPKDVLAFLRTWYVPGNATLVIAGSFPRDEALLAVRRYFGRLPSGSPPSRPTLPSHAIAPARLIVRAGAAGDRVVLAWRTPAFGLEDDAALDVAAVALAGAGNERFSRALIATNLVASISARQRSQREASVFFVEAKVAPGVDPESVIKAVQGVVDDFARSAASSEIQRAVGIWRNAAFLGLESTWGRASRLVEARKLGVDPGPGFDWGSGRYGSLGVSDVRRAAANWLVPAHRITMLISADRAAPARGVLVRKDDIGRDGASP